MSRLMTAVLFFILAGPLRAGEPAADDSASDREARLTAVEGSVYLHLPDADPDEFIAGEKDAPIETGDLIRTGSDGRAELTVDGQTIIDLAPNTDFVVNSLAPEQTEFHLGIGSIAAKIKKLLEGQAMTFHTPTAVAAVRGTELGVSQAGDDSPAEIGVFDEGHVAVTAPGASSEVQLGPGQETEVAKGGRMSAPRALISLAGERERMGLLRKRQAFFRRNWKPMNFQQRLARIGQLRRRPAFRAAQLRNVRADIRARDYGQLRERQRMLREQRRQWRQQRQQRREQRREQRRQRRRQSGQQPRQTQRQAPPQRQTQEKAADQESERRREEQIREQRRQQAEKHRQELQQRKEEQRRERQAQLQRWKEERRQDRQARQQRRRERDERFQQAQAERRQKAEEFRRQREQRRQQNRQNQNAENRGNRFKKKD